MVWPDSDVFRTSHFCTHAEEDFSLQIPSVSIDVMSRRVPKRPRRNLPPRRPRHVPPPAADEVPHRPESVGGERAKNEKIKLAGKASLAVAGSSAEMTPAQRLEQVAKGEAVLQREDLQSVLASHVVVADQRARDLDSQITDLISMMFALPDPEAENNAEERTDAGAVLQLIERLSRLKNDCSGPVRKTVRLLDQLSRPRVPEVRVVAKGEQVNLGVAQQIDRGRGSSGLI